MAGTRTLASFNADAQQQLKAGKAVEAGDGRMFKLVNGVPTSTGMAPAKSDPKVDPLVRQMFGDVAAFLTDRELGPLLRKAASEGWDNSRLMGALQQTKFWKTKGDAERKWIILNKLDNATAKSQVQAQMQAITDLTRSENVTLSGLQIHDLAVNVLKNGWSGSQIREQMLKLVPQRGMTQAIGAQYGYLAAFVSHPEVGPLLDRGAREGWTQQRLEAELQKTNWWKTTSDAQRRFSAAQQQDPETARQAVAQRQSELLVTAQGMGVRMEPDRLRQIAEDSLRFGWDDSQVRRSIAAEYDYNGAEFGQAGQTARQFKQLASDYLVPMSDQTMEKWVEDVVAGNVDEEGFRSYLTEQAKSLFPSLSGAIDRGVTVRQYADPYVQIAARELEMNPESIDLNSPKWRNMLDQVDPKTGERTSMTLSQAQRYLRTQPEWQMTRGANESAAALTENILRTFGAVAG